MVEKSKNDNSDLIFREAGVFALKKIEEEIGGCDLCPRLREHSLAIAKTKKREFRDWEYWGKPVAGFGDPNARLWIVGLAPAAHGANRTGRMFTGDSSGRWLYRALHRAGFANQPHGERRNDGLRLDGVYISSAARCAPPDNRPRPDELSRCQKFLSAEYDALPRSKLILALGAIGWGAVKKLLEAKGMRLPRSAVFGHGLLHEFPGGAILMSYHPSRQNTQTGRLTEGMWNEVFDRARDWLAQHADAKISSRG